MNACLVSSLPLKRNSNQDGLRAYFIILSGRLTNWDWLFIYSIPCHVEILPEPYLSHFAVLVSGVFILYSECISEADLNAASADLLNFVQDFEVLYGPSQMLYNVHLLTHLTFCVKSWGPLWASSLFSPENDNGVLKKLVSGTRGVMTQIARKYCMFSFLPATLSPFVISGVISNKCKNLLIPRKKKTEFGQNVQCKPSRLVCGHIVF